MRARVALATRACGFFERTRETVGCETPALRATSAAVTLAVLIRFGTLPIRIGNRSLSRVGSLPPRVTTLRHQQPLMKQLATIPSPLTVPAVSSAALERETLRRVTWRLIPLLFVLYIFN